MKLIIIDRAFGTGSKKEGRQCPLTRFWYNLKHQNLIFSNGLGMLLKRSPATDPSHIVRTSYGSALQQKGCAMSTLGLSWKICESSLLLPLGTQPHDFLRSEKAYAQCIICSLPWLGCSKWKYTVIAHIPSPFKRATQKTSLGIRVNVNWGRINVKIRCDHCTVTQVTCVFTPNQPGSLRQCCRIPIYLHWIFPILQFEILSLGTFINDVP